ncbi:Flagellar hook-length control protein FliK [Archangium gephyra]|uniref:Flagellar hook-length control protein FliK n=1 Tax=Archangium gephyra TaxID=48 RepID=A0AAC8QBN4_9BACT|nr:Flagellar hook-length control protein FliK [Archangium gephyra]
MAVVIEGENFLPLATQHLGGEAPVTLDDHFEAFLDEVVLEDVTWVDARTLRARVPGGLAPGWHSLAVVGPQGVRVELPRAYLSSLAPLARLEAWAVLERGQVSVQERTRLVVTVENKGTSAALAVTPVLHPVGEGRVEVVSEPGPTGIAAGGSASFAWELAAAAAGDVLFTLEVQGSEELTGTALRAPDVEVGPLRIRNRAVLSASFLSPEHQLVNVGQRVKVSLLVTNTGETGAIGVVPGVPVVTGPLAVAVSGPAPRSADLPPGASQEFAWEYVAGQAGTLVFQVDAAGRDAFSAVEVRAPEARSAGISVQLPAELAVRFPSLPTSVNQGQEFLVEVEVTNKGDSALRDVVLDGEGASGTCAPELVPGTMPWPASVDLLPGKGKAMFRARLIGKAEGSCVFHTGARGKDQTDGVTVVLAPVNSSTLFVRRPAALTATLSAPSGIKPGNTFDVTLTVTNTGSTLARGVNPSLPESSSTVAELVAGPATSGVDVAGGASTTFQWKYHATRVGKASFRAEAGGQDANTGAAVATGPVSSGEVSIVPEVEKLLDNPLGDGTPFAQVLGYDGRVYLGPNKGGTGGVSVDLEGLAGQSFGFFLHKDTSGNVSQNTSAAPYPSIGKVGCRVNTPECGPDNEDGRGLFFSGRVGTQEWLGIGGGKSGGDLDYVYLGQDTDDLNTMYLRHVDLSALLGGNTRGFSSAFFFRDRLYLGFPDTGGSRPYLLVVKRFPTVDPGYDAVSGTEVENLRADNMPGIGGGGTPKNTATVQMIDTLAGFNDRLYVVNNGGCVRSTTPTPRSYSSFPGDWASCTPSLTDWSSRLGRTTTKTADLEPADRAVPQLAVFQGKLYLARNTTSPAGVRGPQLFVCGPERTGSTTDCDPGDWSLVAPNSTGDTLLTQFNDPDNVSLSLLVATANALYVGFDNASRGVVLLRAPTAAPVSRDDFKGREGCSAAQFPSTCEGLAGNGLGAGATRIFDGKVLGASTGERIYLTAGNGVGPAGLYRLVD